MPVPEDGEEFLVGRTARRLRAEIRVRFGFREATVADVDTLIEWLRDHAAPEAGGEMASNRREDHEISMLALHLIQNCMVYINTLMIQKVLAQPHWQGKLTPRDYAALTPLIWEHVNPYGRFDLDMNARLALL